MASVSEITEQVQALLDETISLEQFEDWSAEYSWNIHLQAEQDAANLAYAIRAILNAYAEDSTEVGLREALNEAIFPFAQPRSYARAREVIYGKPLLRASSAYPARQILRSATM